MAKQRFIASEIQNLYFQIKYTQDRDAGIYECQVKRQIQIMIDMILHYSTERVNAMLA